MPVQRKSIRLKEYDYTSTGAYFITIIAYKRQNIFGTILSQKMQLNACGNILIREWIKSTEIRKEIMLDEFVVMPNHFHAIVFIQHDFPHQHPGDRPVAPTGQRLPAGPAEKSLAALIANFKAACSSEFKQSHGSSGKTLWQRNYYERVIRNQRELDAVREYIRNNPLSWKEDPENSDS